LNVLGFIRRPSLIAELSKRRTSPPAQTSAQIAHVCWTLTR